MHQRSEATKAIVLTLGKSEIRAVNIYSKYKQWKALLCLRGEE